MKLTDLRIAYITAQVPWGRYESFVIDEILEVQKCVKKLVVVPLRPGKKVFHTEAAIISHSVRIPLLSLDLIIFFLFGFAQEYSTIWRLIVVLWRESRSYKIFLKNTLLLPKSFYVANTFKEDGISHIHAHWASTPSTMAYIISALTGIPWSFTAHRGDLYENNMFREKARTASFIRFISKKGMEDGINITGQEFAHKGFVIHLGVNIAENRIRRNNGHDEYICIACPANLLPVKGHQYLLQACKILKTEGVLFRCLIIGEGKLLNDLRNMSSSLDIEDCLTFTGMLPHEELMLWMKQGKFDIVVLPSINTANGEHEGIPVVLMEGMACKIPVISTNTGSISELLGGDAGILVPEKDPTLLAYALKKLIMDGDYRLILGMRGYSKVEQEFNLEINVKKLLNIISKYVSK